MKNILFGIVLSLSLWLPNAYALSLDVSFDTTLDGTVTPPWVGAGTFRFDGDPGDGTFALTSLPDFNFFFDFGGGNVFTNADIATPLNEVLVVITSNADRQLNFSNIFGSGTGPFNGSIDFISTFNPSNTLLSFEPNGGPLYFSGNGVGTYAAVASTAAIPAPGSLLLTGLGLAALGGGRRRRGTESNVGRATV